MTLVVGFHFGDYVLVGADTRITLYAPSGPRWADGNRKVVRTGLGLAAGAGLVSLLDPVKEALDEGISTVDDVQSVISAVRDDFESRGRLDDPRVLEALEKTAWLFTYLTLVDDVAVIRLALATSARGDPMMHILPGDPWILPPTGTSEAQMDEWMDRLKASMLPRERGGALDSHVLHHILLLSDLIADVSEVNDGVAPTFQLGLHLLPSKVGISGIYGPNAQVEWDWGDD